MIVSNLQERNILSNIVVAVNVYLFITFIKKENFDIIKSVLKLSYFDDEITLSIDYFP